MAEGTSVQICGRVVARLGTHRVERALPGRQGRVLFVYLVRNRLRPVTRDELLEAVWPHDLPPAAESALSALLSKLRRALGGDALEGRGELQLVLPKPVFVDLEAADEAAHRAESAVRRRAWAEAWGPSRVALHTAARGFLHGEDAPWIDETRRHLDDLRLRALECIARSSLALGATELDSAKRSARTLIELVPYRESGYRYLMEALAAEGNAAEALAVYDRLRRLLRDELGAAPSAPTQEVYRTLLG